MDYKEKYEKLHRFVNDLYPHMSDYCKEKVDERIRKDIIKVFTGEAGFTTKEEAKKYVAWLEKQGEQNPVDKVEPRFKIGDWLINRHGNIRQVIDIKDRLYYCIRIECCDTKDTPWSGAFEYVDGNWRKWTIQDAKDGDVLFTENKNIFIFKSISDYTVYDYCGLYFGKFSESSSAVNGSKATQLPTDYVPATKEQRELLLEKIVDAGYIWDPEKKELKKIEQKPTWSEEDEQRIESVIEHLENSISDTPSSLRPYVRKDIDWLKSLKDRYTWKPSDEQIKALSAINVTGGISYVGQGQELINLYNDLKKLREE